MRLFKSGHSKGTITLTVIMYQTKILELLNMINVPHLATFVLQNGITITRYIHPVYGGIRFHDLSVVSSLT